MAKCILFLVFMVGSTSFSFGQKWVETSSDILGYGMPAATGIYMLFWDNEDNNEKQFVLAAIVTADITLNLKYAFNKTRPNGENLSFPSGHTSMTFTCAAFAQKRYGWKTGLPMYLLAGYTGWTRIKANKHDFIDVLSGAALGTTVGLLFAQKKSEKFKPSVSWDGQTMQTGIIYTF